MASEKCCVNLHNFTIQCSSLLKCTDVKEKLSLLGIPTDCYYLVKNGKKVEDDDVFSVHVNFVPRLLGGKGGFGSMLRAIGAQIEKTTNREACRDLSGRRLRDINEEQRLKNWISQQAERERESAERKRKKLERLCREPKHDFKDESYEKERSELTEKVSSSVEEGFKKASTSGTSIKRTKTEPADKRKKKKLWIDADEDFSSSEDEKSSLSVKSECKSKASTSTGVSQHGKMSGPASKKKKKRLLIDAGDDFSSSDDESNEDTHLKSEGISKSDTIPVENPPGANPIIGTDVRMEVESAKGES